MQLDLDFTNKGWRRWAIDRCTRLRTLSVVEGGRRRNLNCSEAKILLYKIAEYDDCYASIGKLSDDTGIPKRNIERLLKAMEEAGLLKKEPREVERGQFPTNRYVVFYSELAYVAESSATSTKSERIFLASPSAQPTAQPSAQPTAHWAGNKEIKRLKKETSSSNSKKPRNSSRTTCNVSTETEEEEIFSLCEDGTTFEEVVTLFGNHRVGTAKRLVTSAVQRGCSLRSLKAIVLWFNRYIDQEPTRWDKPDSVLMIRLQNARKGVPCWKGWIPGKRKSSKEFEF